ncbi:hypothetical protein L211DRAFT_846146 [Terfezia boudieri ATCC MYA-4762]|uniref:Uncharacterized protein n=1 Tax=Terfezia boudieri ATCC MYA-4762 TaxID=1051890 RepID=A0A3N4M0F0_9PEZI|nr:hypothetical protein L211DRAFT_846146 [Terfezia boudieri ATCC MYA-4762]
MNDLKLCRDTTRLLPEHSEDESSVVWLAQESSGSFTPDNSSEWEDEEPEDEPRLGYHYVPGLPPPMQLSSRVPMVKGKAKSITIDSREKKKADEVVSTATLGNAACWLIVLKSTTFEIYKPPLDARQPLPETIKQIGLQTEKTASTSSAAILREEVQRLAVANPSMVSTMQSKATKQLGKRRIEGGTKPQSVLANPAQEKASSVKMAQTTATQPKQTQTATQTKQTHTAAQMKLTQFATQTKQTLTATQMKQPQTATQMKQTQPATQLKQTQPATQLKQTQIATQTKQTEPATQPKQTQPASRSLELQFKPGSTGTSTIFAAPAAANAPFGNQPNQQPTPAPQAQTPTPSPMWHFTGRSGGPPTPNPPPKTQHSQQAPAPIPATSNGGQSSGSNYTDDEFLHNYATYRYANMQAMTEYIERSLLHSCNRRECFRPGIQADGTFKFYRPPPTLTFTRPYGPGLAEGATPRRRRQEGRKIKESYYD